MQVFFQAQHLDVPTANWGRVQPSFSVMWFSSFSLACCFLPSSLTIFSFNHWYDWREGGQRVEHVSEGGGCKYCCKRQTTAWKTHQVSHVPLLSGFDPGKLVWLVLLFIFNLFHKPKRVHIVLEDPGTGLYVDPEPIKNWHIVLDISAWTYLDLFYATQDHPQGPWSYVRNHPDVDQGEFIGAPVPLLMSLSWYPSTDVPPLMSLH